MASGMSTGNPADFNRKRWDSLTATNIVPPRTNVLRRSDLPWINTTDITVPSFKEADPALAIRRYCIQSAESKPRLVLIYFHGGGMCINTERSKSTEDIVVGLVRRLACDAISVGYRLAPEHPFPCALRDAYTALRWLHAQDEYRNAGIVLAGDSSGGNLAIVLALLTIEGVDADGNAVAPELSAALRRRIWQLTLLYPSLYELATRSQTARTVSYLMPRRTSAFYVRAYLGDEPTARDARLRDWRATFSAGWSTQAESCLSRSGRSSASSGCPA